MAGAFSYLAFKIGEGSTEVSTKSLDKRKSEPTTLN
jgi:hypothetical protein